MSISSLFEDSQHAIFGSIMGRSVLGETLRCVITPRFSFSDSGSQSTVGKFRAIDSSCPRLFSCGTPALSWIVSGGHRGEDSASPLPLILREEICQNGGDRFYSGPLSSRK